MIAIEKLSDFTYRIYPFESKNVRDGAAIPDHWPEINRDKPTVIDLFAGCGGMSIGLKKAGFENLLAVEWDESCCDRTVSDNEGVRTNSPILPTSCIALYRDNSIVPCLRNDTAVCRYNPPR